MNHFIQSTAVALVLAIAGVWSAHAATDSVRRDPQSGDWIFTVTNAETNEQKGWRYTPRNQFEPRIHNTVRWTGSQFEYRYRLHNSGRSRLSIAFMWVDEARMEMPGAPDSSKLNMKDFPTQAAWWKAANDVGAAKDAFIAKSIASPKDWRGRIAIDKQGIGREFGWFAHPNVLTSDLAPGQTLHGAYLLRPELPGVGLAGMMGATEERGRASGLPETGPLADAWAQIEATDKVVVPVLVPAVAVPAPYVGAELARRLRDEVSSWPSLEVASQDAVNRLNRQFDALIPALESNNKAAARAAAIEMLKEVFGRHRGLNHHKLGEDDEDQAAEALPPRHAGRSVTTPGPAAQAPAVHRVAARALAFNLMYLLTRMEIGR